MSRISNINNFLVLTLIIAISILACSANIVNDNELHPHFYRHSCPNLHTIVLNVMTQAVAQDPRLGASMLRLFFHDCFVKGCDGSILLDGTPSFTGEKNALPNRNSVRGFEVIDTIKARVEAACNATVSCADILALAAKDGTTLSGGPSWVVPLGRRDARTASQSAANTDLPSPFANLQSLKASFASKGLSARDMTALSGAHTIGLARCSTFRPRIYSATNIDPSFAATRQATCPVTGGDSNLAPLDVQSPNQFGNSYYQNLVNKRGLLFSDQELYSGGSQDSLTWLYSMNQHIFYHDFADAMVKMGNISPLTGLMERLGRIVGWLIN